MKRNFIEDNLFQHLGIPSSSNENTIKATLASLASRMNASSTYLEEDVELFNRLQELSSDKMYRLRSMIFKGGFGYEEVDLQLGRLKALLNKVKVISQEWLDVYDSWIELISRPDFSEKVLSKCLLTDPSSHEDQQLMSQLKKEVIEFFLEIQVEKIEESVLTGDKSSSLAHFEVLHGVSGIDDQVKSFFHTRALEHLSKFVQNRIPKIEAVIRQIEGEKSKFEAKALIGRLDRDCRDSFDPFYVYFKEKSFPGQKGIVDSIEKIFNQVIPLIEERGKKEAAVYYKNLLGGKLNPQVSKKNKSDSLPSSNITTAKDDLSEYGGDSLKDASADIKAQLKEIQDIAASGKLSKAQAKFNRYKLKNKDVAGIQAFERVSNDPVFLLNKQDTDPRSGFMLKWGKPFKHQQNGSFLQNLWFKLIIPLWPSKTYAFNVEGKCLGQAPTDSTAKNVQNLFLLGILVLLFIPVFFMGDFSSKSSVSGKLQTQPVKTVSEEEIEKAPLQSLINTLSQSNIGNREVILERVLRRIPEALENSITNNKSDFFVKNAGIPLSRLPQKEKFKVFDSLEGILIPYLEKQGYQPDILFDWSLKMSRYSLSRDMVVKKLKYLVSKNEVSKARSYLKKSNHMAINLPSDLLLKMLQTGVSTTEAILLACDNFSSLPLNIWEEGIIKLWEGVSNFSEKEALQVIQKASEHMPKYELNLLSILVDTNKNKFFTWEDKLPNRFYFPAIEKRLKIQAALSLLKKGEKEKALEIAKTIPVQPENQSLLFERIPILYAQKKYRRIDYIFNSYYPKKKLSNYYMSIKGLASFYETKDTSSIKIIEDLTFNGKNKYLSLWKQLNKRTKVVRDYVSDKLKTKSEPYRQEARRIYLINDSQKAAYEKEIFIQSIIDKDHKVINLRKLLDENYFYLLGAYGLVEGYIQQKDPKKLRVARDLLFDFKANFKNSQTDIMIGEISFHLGKENSAIKTFKEVVEGCKASGNYTPCLELLEVYDQLKFTDMLRKLLKLLLKKNRKLPFKNEIARKMFRVERKPNKKLEWLSQVKNKSVYEVALETLYKSRMYLGIKENNQIQEILPLFNKVASNINQIADYPEILEDLGEEGFKWFRQFGDVSVLSATTQFFKFASLVEEKNLSLRNQYWNSLWFKFLKDIFPGIQYSIHEITESHLEPLWDGIWDALSKSKGQDLINKITNSKYLRDLEKILSSIIRQEKPFVVIPPGFFELVKVKSMYNVFAENFLILSKGTIESRSFSSFWGIKSYIENINLDVLKKKEENLAKDVKSASKDQSPDYAGLITEWARVLIKEWIYSQTPLKTGLDGLLSKVELSNALVPSFISEKLLLDIKLLKQALWLDPNKIDIKKYSPVVVVINRMVGQNKISVRDLEDIAKSAKKLMKEMGGFFNSEIALAAGIIDSGSVELDSHVRLLIETDFILFPNDLSKKLLKEKFSKRSL